MSGLLFLKKGDIMTDYELKKFAAVGMQIRIDAEQKRIERIKNIEDKERAKAKLCDLELAYRDLLKEIMEYGK
jgi:hypothetical protein